ncbi:unnamed protein product [Blepharisma stoltei]|uniref:Uncharacterized protein n=1 Tax=Blepharisma stoltei TaxID=1481888 RepID=A0AAU9JSV7_9CILI|nr:unnamed protein product [Blepharisma stoltei]
MQSEKLEQIEAEDSSSSSLGAAYLRDKVEASEDEISSENWSEIYEFNRKDNTPPIGSISKSHWSNQITPLNLFRAIFFKEEFIIEIIKKWMFMQKLFQKVKKYMVSVTAQELEKWIGI